MAAAVVALASACHSPTSTWLPSSVAVGIVPLTASALRGVVNQPLAQPVTVEVVDQYGIGIGHVSVLWITGYNSGSVDSAMTMTDNSGVAAVRWTLGTIAQVDTLTATIPDGATTLITATAVAGASAGLATTGPAERVRQGRVRGAFSGDSSHDRIY